MKSQRHMLMVHSFQPWGLFRRRQISPIIPKRYAVASDCSDVTCDAVFSLLLSFESSLKRAPIGCILSTDNAALYLLWMWAQAGFDVLWNTIPELHGGALHAVSFLPVWRARRRRARSTPRSMPTGSKWTSTTLHVDLFFFCETSRHVWLFKYYAWARARNGSQVRSDSACSLIIHSVCVCDRTSRCSVLTTLHKSVCVCLRVYGLLCVLKDQRLWGREDIFILVNLRLIPLCPLSSCHIRNSFMDALALLRLIAMSDSCPGLAQQSRGRQPSAQLGQGLDLTFRTIHNFFSGWWLSVFMNECWAGASQSGVRHDWWNINTEGVSNESSTSWMNMNMFDQRMWYIFSKCKEINNEV